MYKPKKKCYVLQLSEWPIPGVVMEEAVLKLVSDHLNPELGKPGFNLIQVSTKNISACDHHPRLFTLLLTI